MWGLQQNFPSLEVVNGFSITILILILIFIVSKNREEQMKLVLSVNILLHKEVGCLQRRRRTRQSGLDVNH